MGRQFLFRGPAHEVELNHLQGANGRLAANPETDQQAGDDGQVDLNRHTVAAFGQQMTATKDAFGPPEKQLHGPAITVTQSDHLRGEIEPIRRQEQEVRPALRIGLAGIDFDDAEGLLESTAALGAAEPHEAIATHAGGTRLFSERAFFDDGPDGIVANAADEVAAGIDDVLKKLILGIATIDDVEALGLQRGA